GPPPSRAQPDTAFGPALVTAAHAPAAAAQFIEALRTPRAREGYIRVGLAPRFAPAAVGIPGTPRIVQLHATPVAVGPVEHAFAELWPEAEVVNLLDDALSTDRARDGDLTAAMTDRFLRFGRYAHSLGASGILVTCSAFGPAIDRMATELPVPVL